MTAQFPDLVRHAGQQYELAGINGEGLFEPEAHGMAPRGTCSACWRGYVATYAVVDDRLVLAELDVNLGAGGEAEEPGRPALNGVGPGAEAGADASLFDTHYRNVNLPLPFTGGLLLAAGFIQELYVHMGFHPAWKYEEVHELLFEAGALTAARDVSARMREFRDEVGRRSLEPDREVLDEDLRRWIERCFSRQYTL